MDKLLFIDVPFLTGKPLEVWLDSMGIKDWSINSDGLVDVKGGVALDRKLGELKRLPVRFGQVGGDFLCRRNQLVSLEGAPKVMGGNFSCSENQLVSLEGVPKEVGRSLYCQYNRLVSLEGAPKELGGDFWCKNNRLVSLKGGPEKVGGSFWCQSNQLVSLEGAPKYTEGIFWCDHNQLVDFKGMEGVSIEGTLIVTAPSEAGQDNVFVSLEGLPKELYGNVRGLDVAALLAAESQHSGILDIEI